MTWSRNISLVRLWKLVLLKSWGDKMKEVSGCRWVVNAAQLVLRKVFSME